MIEVFSPAKINLFLGVIGKRKDEFHELLSLVAPVNFGDTLNIELVNDKDSIESDFIGLPMDEENIILKAIKAFRRKYAFENGVKVLLDKKIPIGAGLGGGSSNAIATLKGVNYLLGHALNQEDLQKIAIALGSDCVLFFENGPVIMKGRGEIVEALDEELKEKLKGQRVLIFKPKFSVDTKWAYQQMALNPKFYIEREDAEFILKEGIEQFLTSEDLSGVLYNNFEKIILEKYKELGELMKNLKKQFRTKVLLSGSGSACFCTLDEKSDISGILKMIKEVLGKDIFIVETTIY